MIAATDISYPLTTTTPHWCIIISSSYTFWGKWSVMSLQLLLCQFMLWQLSLLQISFHMRFHQFLAQSAMELCKAYIFCEYLRHDNSRCGLSLSLYLSLSRSLSLALSLALSLSLSLSLFVLWTERVINTFYRNLQHARIDSRTHIITLMTENTQTSSRMTRTHRPGEGNGVLRDSF